MMNEIQERTSDRITQEQMETLVKGLNKNDKYLDGLYCVVSYTLGLRVSDTLQIRKYDFSKKSFSILEKKVRKYRKPRKLYISKLMKYQYDLCVKNNVLNPHSEYVFVNSKGNLLSSRGYLKKIKGWGIDYLKCQIQSFSTHSFRKGFGYSLYKQTNDIGLVCSCLGHTNTDTTLRYIGIVSDDRKKGFGMVDFTL